MKKILLLSDTHGHIDEQILGFASQADEVWHAGDIGSWEVADRLAKTSLLRAVWGNIDGAELRAQFPENQKFLCEGVSVWMTHIGGYPGRYAPGVGGALRANPPQLFICGHSHILKVMPDASLGLLAMNPGAAGKYGYHQVRTMLRFEIDKNRPQNLEVIELPR